VAQDWEGSGLSGGEKITPFTHVIIVTAKYFIILNNFCDLQFYNLQCTIPSTINHTLTKLRLLYYVQDLRTSLHDCCMQVCSH